MAAISAKKVEGQISDLTPTTIVVDGKTIFVPQDKRKEVEEKKYQIGDKIKMTYTHKGDYLWSELIPPIEPKKASEYINTKATPTENLHMQPDKAVTTVLVTGEERAATAPAAGIENVHIQEPKPDNPLPPTIPAPAKKVHIDVPAKEWIGERERHETIVWQSVLARAVEIVNAEYIQTTSNTSRTPIFAIPTESKPFETVLGDRCTHIEVTADRLYKFVKQKVKENHDK